MSLKSVQQREQLGSKLMKQAVDAEQARWVGTVAPGLNALPTPAAAQAPDSEGNRHPAHGEGGSRGASRRVALGGARHSARHGPIEGHLHPGTPGNSEGIGAGDGAGIAGRIGRLGGNRVRPPRKRRAGHEAPVPRAIGHRCPRYRSIQEDGHPAVGFGRPGDDGCRGIHHGSVGWSHDDRCRRGHCVHDEGVGAGGGAGIASRIRCQGRDRVRPLRKRGAERKAPVARAVSHCRAHHGPVQ